MWYRAEAEDRSLFHVHLLGPSPRRWSVLRLDSPSAPVRLSPAHFLIILAYQNASHYTPQSPFFCLHLLSDFNFLLISHRFCFRAVKSISLCYINQSHPVQSASNSPIDESVWLTSASHPYFINTFNTYVALLDSSTDQCPRMH